MSLTRPLVALACLTAATACGVDHATSPDFDPSVAAAVGSPPSAVSSSPISASSIGVYWQDNSPNEEGFEVRRSTSGANGTFTAVGTTGPNATSYTDSGLQPHTQYCYVVLAFRKNGARTAYSSPSTVTCATTFGPPAAPASLTAVPQGNATVMVSWSASTDATSYRVERAASADGPWQSVVTLSTTSFADGQRPVETLVCYRVAAVNQWGEGLSATRCTTPPAAPTTLAVTAPTAGGLDLSWNDASAFEDGYEVQRTLTSSISFSTVGTTAANATSYHDATAAADVRYYYRVRATKDGGYGDFSPWAEGISPSSVPPAPTDLVALPYGSSAVDVRWTSTATNAAGIRVERAATTAGPWSTVASVAWSQTDLVDSPVDPETEVCYRAIAFNDKGDSPPSTPDCARPLAAPDNLVVTGATSDAIDLAWNDNSNYEGGYEVHRIECYYYYYYGYPYCYVAESIALGANTTTYHFAGLAPGTDYTFEVVATGTKNGLAYSSYTSNQITGTTSP